MALPRRDSPGAREPTVTHQELRDEEVQWALHQQREFREFAERKALWIEQANEDLLNRALFKADGRRFTGQGPSNFAPLMDLPS